MGFFIEGDDRYCLALGRFITSFADAEQFLHRTLRKVTGVSGPVAPAIFSGVRPRAAMDLIRRVHEAQGIRLEDPLEEVFAHFSMINTARDALVHWTVSPRDSEEVEVSNWLTAHTQRSYRAYPASHQALEDLEADTKKICSMLMLYLWSHRPDVQAKLLAPGSFARESLQWPWRYRPPQPTLPRRKSVSGNDKPQSQPESPQEE